MRTKYLVGKDEIENVDFVKVYFRRNLASGVHDTVKWHLSYFYGKIKYCNRITKYSVSYWDILLSRRKAQLEKLIGHTFVYSTRTAKRVGVYT